MTTILCYGDSNTHGRVPGDGPVARFGRAERWPGVMRAALPEDWEVIEEGLNGRSTVWDDPYDGQQKNGRRYLTPCLLSHAPIDYLIIMLGTNDLKRRYGPTAEEVALGMGCLVADTHALAPGHGGARPEIILVSPPPMLDDLGRWSTMFEGAQAISRQLPKEYAKQAKALGVRCLDAGSVCKSDPADGFHLNADAHFALGTALAALISDIDGGRA